MQNGDFNRWWWVNKLSQFFIDAIAHLDLPVHANCHSSLLFQVFNQLTRKSFDFRWRSHNFFFYLIICKTPQAILVSCGFVKLWKHTLEITLHSLYEFSTLFSWEFLIDILVWVVGNLLKNSLIIFLLFIFSLNWSLKCLINFFELLFILEDFSFGS